MQKDVLFWVLVILFIIFSVYVSWPITAAGYPFLASNAFIIMLLTLLGWRVFGPPVK